MKVKRTGTGVLTGLVRFSYVHAFEPYAGDAGQEAKYSVSLLIRKDDSETIAAIREAVAEATDQGQTSKWGGKVPRNLKTPIRDGDTEKDTDEHPEYKGMYFINASSKRKPGIVDRHVNPIFDAEDLKSGDWGRADINFYAFAVNGNNGIACGLNNLQKIKDGESLGGSGQSAEAVFESEDDDDDMLD